MKSLKKFIKELLDDPELRAVSREDVIKKFYSRPITRRGNIRYIRKV